MDCTGSNLAVTFRNQTIPFRSCPWIPAGIFSSRLIQGWPDKRTTDGKWLTQTMV